MNNQLYKQRTAEHNRLRQTVMNLRRQLYTAGLFLTSIISFS